MCVCECFLSPSRHMPHTSQLGPSQRRGHEDPRFLSLEGGLVLVFSTFAHNHKHAYAYWIQTTSRHKALSRWLSNLILSERLVWWLPPALSSWLLNGSNWCCASLPGLCGNWWGQAWVEEPHQESGIRNNGPAAPPSPFLPTTKSLWSQKQMKSLLWSSFRCPETVKTLVQGLRYTGSTQRVHQITEMYWKKELLYMLSLKNIFYNQLITDTLKCSIFNQLSSGVILGFYSLIYSDNKIIKYMSNLHGNMTSC